MELCTKQRDCNRQLYNKAVGGIGTSIIGRFLFALSILVFLIFANNNQTFAQFAPETRTVGVFELRFYSGSISDYNYVPNTNSYSDRPFTSAMIDETVKYIGYWEELINTSRVNGNDKIIINFRYDSSVPTATGGGSNIVNIINKSAKPSTTQTDAMISIGGRFDQDTIIHEFGHVIGFTRGDLAPYLVDIYGEKYTDTDTDNVAITGDGNGSDGIFNLYEDATDFKYPMFLGRQNGAIEELIGSVHNADGTLDKSKLDILSQAAIQGTSVPPTLDGTGVLDVDLSHTGNMHSLMSYGSFINMPFIPEIELAMLEELGYSIDRRKAFGHSYYNRSDNLYSGQVKGVGYDSDFIFGVGAHVFMDGLDLLQSAGISSRGEEGAGIRIDGSNNIINIDKYTPIEASGEKGIGLFTAWGSNNILIHRGDISATGEGGIGVKLSVEGASSYYAETGTGEARTIAEYTRARADLIGALVDRFDISGKITGKDYAIYISNTAHVEEINIMNGADIYGKIQSSYPSGSGSYYTNLTFGKKADANGAATDSDDSSFNFVLHDGLEGQNQFDITTYGGVTTIGENAYVHAKSATIRSNSQFNIASNYQHDNQNKVYVGSLTLESNAILGINPMYSEGENIPFLQTPVATINADAKLDLTSFRKGVFTVLSATTLSAAGFDQNDILVAGQAPTIRHQISMNTTDGTIKLTLDATNVDLKWKGGDGIWDNGKKSWYDNGSEDVFINGDTVTFDKGTGKIDVPVSVEVPTAVFSSGAKYRFSGAKIFVTNNLSITQAGTETRFNQDVQTGSLTVNNATLGIGANNIVSVQGDATLNQATLEIGTGDVDTSAGKISVAGKATISGGIVNLYGEQRTGIQYLFLEAGDLVIDPNAGGLVLGATANGQRGILSYDTNINKYWVMIEGLLIDHSRNAFTHNQRHLGSYLNALSPRVNEFNDMNNVLMKFENLAANSPVRYRSAMDETMGNIYASAGSASVQNTTIANRTIATYLRRPPLSEVIPCHICRGVCQHLINKPTSWITAIGMGGTTQNDSNSNGYSQSSGGSVFGVDIMRRIGVHFGFYGSAMENVLTSKNVREHSRSHEFMGGFYFRADNSIGYLLLNNGYGFNQYKTDRTMTEFDNRKARSSNDSFNSTVYAELGTYYLDPVFHWHGYVGLQYAGVYQEAVSEHGAGALDVIGEPVSTTSMRVFLGVRTERFERTLLGGMISGDFNFAWMHECIGRTQSEFTGRFAGSPDGSLRYKVSGTNTGRDWAIFGASIGYDFGRTRFFGSYDAYLSGYQSLHSGTLGVVYVW
ncbi:MAG: autotransporter outer membrane beta-barrel domain-containing protein [Planctomycetaceae bacterium]|jgi:uncharacterized protein with beta-barrel porin domain|nr:autotransporter outer membrane beta-barrel domain-containing protein [Planctomycetaceae bacterium]